MGTLFRPAIQLLQIAADLACDLRHIPGMRVKSAGAAIYYYRPQSSSASRMTAGAFGFLTFTQCGDRPER
jgi:hypothetical protein